MPLQPNVKKYYLWDNRNQKSEKIQKSTTHHSENTSEKILASCITTRLIPATSRTKTSEHKRPIGAKKVSDFHNNVDKNSSNHSVVLEIATPLFIGERKAGSQGEVCLQRSDYTWDQDENANGGCVMKQKPLIVTEMLHVTPTHLWQKSLQGRACVDIETQDMEYQCWKIHLNNTVSPYNEKRKVGDPEGEQRELFDRFVSTDLRSR